MAYVMAHKEYGMYIADVMGLAFWTKKLCYKTLETTLDETVRYKLKASLDKSVRFAETFVTKRQALEYLNTFEPKEIWEKEIEKVELIEVPDNKDGLCYLDLLRHMGFGHFLP